MMGETTTGNEVENSGETEAVSAERRPSIVTLQNMLRRVSHSPFHNQYEVGHVSAAATDVMDKQELHLKQNGLETEDSHLPVAAAQNGEQEMPKNEVSGTLDRMNPFYSYYLESGSKGYLQDAGRKPSEEMSFNTLFLPPPEFQSSPMDAEWDVDIVENQTSHFEPPKDLYPELTHNPIPDIFQASALPHNESSNGRFRDVTLNSPDLLQPFQPQNLSTTTDQLKEQVGNPFHPAKTEELLRATHADEVDKPFSVFVDPFKSLSEGDNVFQSLQPTVGNPFYNDTTKDADLFQSVSSKNKELFDIREGKPEMDIFGTYSNEKLNIFSTSSTNTVDPFPSPITRNLFQDVSSVDDPFGDTPPKQSDPFGDISAADIFQPLPSWTKSNGILKTTPDTKATHSASPLNIAAENNLDLQLSSAADESLDPLEPEPLGSHSNIQTSAAWITAAEGPKHNILQPTPFSQASGLSAPPSPSPTEMTHVHTFKRPPKPLPRTRPPRALKPEKPPPPEKPPQPAMPIDPEPVVPKPPPKPALPKLPSKPAFKPLPGIRRRPKPQHVKPVEPENYVVFEDILLLGQEKCVEDWPEDSPELSPDFKPSGALRLRRESLKVKVDSDGGSGEEQEGPGSQSKKRDKKFRVSMVSRRGSKDKFPDDTTEGKSRTLPFPRKSSKDYLSDIHTSPGENEDGEQNGMDHKKNVLKTHVTKVTRLLRRASTTSSVPEGKHMNGHLPQDSKDGDFSKKSKKDSIRRWSEGTVLDDSSGVEEEGGEDNDYTETKKKKKLSIKFVPHRGFTISVKKPQEEPKGAYGHALRKGSKEKSPEEIMGAHGYTPRNKWQYDGSDDVEEKIDLSLQSANQADFVDDEDLKKTHQSFAGLDDDNDDDDEEMCGMGDCKPKNPKHKPPVPPRKPKTSSNSSAQTDQIRLDHTTLQQTSSEDVFAEDERTPKGKYSVSPMDMYDTDQDELDICKPKKSSKLKVLKKLKVKRKTMDLECEDPPGATSSDYMSEAARAEWLAAQKDGRVVDGLEDEDEEGDTDSLMEWWYTVEQWDELPSDDEEIVMKEDESKSFSILADKVHRGLRVFNKVFTERAEVLWQYIISLHAIADDISTFHQKAKIAGITGGTTTAVGGVAAITGLALAPFTFGASLIVTAVGVGVATAGGITSASAAISDNVNNMHDRKKVEVVLEEYEVHLLDIAKILHFINTGLYKLRGHPFLRSGTQHYSEDWEIRRAVQMISLVDSPVMRATEVVDGTVSAVQGLFTGMDKYFTKDSRELKKGCKKEMVGQIKQVATLLNDGIVELNAIREELQDATGTI
ncbi:uncharacterized protein LOC115438886 isoform X2 [Sphaeramia orbicularis]|uniref:uncharacterized protein LOC115438886 isoform X2 n=1 Tax=Sphaeramia orbicularis TaxID=375764 RepID=UPI00117CF406|nr:uncharacterized protein LOC115438886 isoform X2 [Sphaeramia orbicularis]